MQKASPGIIVKRFGIKGFELLAQRVIARNICCGCGGCVVLCPTRAIAIEPTAAGEYQPHLVGDCTQCGFCTKVCPFLFTNKGLDALGQLLFGKLDSMHYRPETGYFHRCFVGFAPIEQVRQNGASGGLTTWLLCELLKRGEVDYVVAVEPNPDPNRLFRYAVLSRVEEVRACSKSAYYPVELSEVLTTILAREGRYAVVGLPCMLKALRHAQDVSPAIKNRVVIVLGLVCGKNKTRLFTEALLRMAGLNPAEVQSVCYRDKRGTASASDFYFSAQEGYSEQRLQWSDGWNRVFTQSWFDLGSCRVCDDIFAECADAVFMDAWLPEYSKDVKGTSFVLSRQEHLSRIFAECCENISIDKITESQLGVILRKRKFLDWELKQESQLIGRPDLALVPGWLRYLPHNYLEWRRRVDERVLASRVCTSNAGEGDWFRDFQQAFSAWQPKGRRYMVLARTLGLPFGVFRRTKRVLKKRLNVLRRCV